ncbi:glucokinase [Friedmanniella luteola]|uniref:Glucokinase n=1 Tax=Friedmanniella luteola TaxID=546871 RepID=A0A1H1MGJ3_9ACTN|nr:ROK family protein [Friedmanniella luteola]SDR85777.1 glucokinase [Friedmanniella luteola]
MSDAGGSDYVVAVDLGGTLTKVAHADADGTVSGVVRLPTQLVDGQASVSWLASVLDDAVAARPAGTCAGFGVVVPGIIDVPRGVVRAAPNVGWYDVPLRLQLSQLTGRTGTVAHDVRSGGLAEWRIGAGVGARNLLFLPLGTGIAGAMVVDGRLVDADGYAGEIGHIAVPAAGDAVCLCGQRGCLETVASAVGVVRTHARLAGTVLDAREVAELARAGDPAARQAFDVAVAALVEALTTYATLLGPETVVIGGGLAGAFDLLGPPVTSGLDARMAFQRRPRLVPARLGADAGVIGAGLVAWDLIREDVGP